MSESVPTRLSLVVRQQLLHDRGLDGGSNSSLRLATHCNENPVGKPAAEHSCRPEHLDLIGAESIHSEQDRVADAGWKAEFCQCLSRPAKVIPKNVTAIEGCLEHLLEHARVPLCPVEEKITSVVLDAIKSEIEDGADHLSHLVCCQRRELDDGCCGAPPPPLNRG